MRTTVTLAKDVAAAVARLRRERAVGLSDALNELARRGIAASDERAPFEQRTSSLGLRIDVADVADAIETLDGPSSR